MLKKLSYFIVFVLPVLMFLLGFFSMRNDSAIRDEMPHSVAGYSYIKYGDYRLNPEHPPLIKALSGLFISFSKPSFPEKEDCWTKDINGQWDCGFKFLYKIGNEADKILFLGRLPLLILACLFGWFLFWSLSQLFNKKVALLSLFFYVFSPNILAHSRFITTDLGITVFFFVACYFFVRFLKKPNWPNLIFSGLTFGLAQLVKFSAVLLIPYFILILIIALIEKRNWKRMIISLFLIFVIGYILVYLVYFPLVHSMSYVDLSRLIQGSLPRHLYLGGPIYIRNVVNKLNNIARYNLLKPVAHYLLGTFMVFGHAAGGHTTYFLGKVGEGWWYFFPVTFVLKTPLPFLILILLTLLFLIWLFIKSIKRKSFLDNLEKGKGKRFCQYIWNQFEIISFVLVIFLWLGTGMMAKINLGLRYILPIYPFLFALISLAIFKFYSLMKRKFKKIFLIFVILLLFWYLGENLFIFPSYLAYFNEFVGSKNAYKYTVDSNLDWGQDLKRLAQWVEKEKINQIKVDYFGGGDPEYYLGKKYIPYYPDRERKGWIAVSVTAMQTGRKNKINYSWLDKYKPVKRIGYSILVYHLKDRD